MPISKKTKEEKMLSSMRAGVNNSNKAQLKRIQKIKITEKREQVPLSDMYVRVNKKWIHRGISCRLCDVIMTDKIVIDKHRYVCDVINKRIKESRDADTED